MDQTYDTLASHLLSLFHARLENIQQDAKLNKRILIGLAGPPGSGKSTIAKEVCKRVNVSWKSNRGQGESENDICVVVGMDGWHYYKAELDQMENPQYLQARRGIPATFNLPSFLSFLTHLSSSPCQYPTTSPFSLNQPPILYAPSFSHSEGDPIPRGIAIEPRHCIVIVEGNYVLLKDQGWEEVARLWDKKWMVKVDEGVARSRVVKRHLESGICKTMEESKKRVEENDVPNGRSVRENSVEPDLIIQSIDVNNIIVDK